MKKGAGKKLNKEAITRQPKKFSAAFYNNYDGKITLKYADEVYLKLTCCTAQDIGKEIREIFEDREYRRIKYYFDSYRGHKFNLKYVEQFANYDYLLWEVNVLIDYPAIKLEGVLMQMEELHKYSKKTQSHKDNMDYGIIIVSKRKEGIFTEFCCDIIMENIPQIKEGEYIKCRNIEGLVSSCIEEKRVIKSCDIYTLSDGSRKIINMSAKPVSRRKSDAAFVEILFSDINAGNMDYENESDEFLQKNIIGNCIINCEIPDNMYFADINSYLARLIIDGKINKKALTEAHPFRRAISERLSSFGMISFYNDNTEKSDYIMGAVPIIQNGMAVRVYMFIIPTFNRDMIDTSIFDRLTPREGNVLRLAVEGMDNRHISNALNISEGTTKRQLFHCYKKLGVKNKIEIFRKLYHL